MPLLSLTLTFAAAPAAADVVHLRDGGQVEGTVLAREASTVTVALDGGRIEIPAQDVVRVETIAHPLEAHARRRRAAPDTRKGRARLARAAAAAGLEAEARRAWREVLGHAPDDAEARRALGHVRREGRWMDETTRRRAEGQVRQGGRWLSEQEAQAEMRTTRAALVEAPEPAPTRPPPPAPPAPPQVDQNALLVPWRLATVRPGLRVTVPRVAPRGFVRWTPFIPFSPRLGLVTRPGAPGGQVLFGPLFPPLPVSGPPPGP